MQHSNTGHSTRRSKLNYNSFYNASLRNNRYLERHPEARRSSWMPYFSGAVEATTSRASLTPAISNSLISPTTSAPDLQKYYVIEETTTIDLAAQSYEEILNEAEDGEILAIEAVTSSPLITIEIVLYGLGNSANILNDKSINEMLSLGRGLTPGDVETLPGGRSKDTTGVPRRYYPYIARYKDDNLIDHLQQARQTFVFVYEPAIPMPYSSIIVNVKNNSTESGKTVDSVNIHRRVFDNPFAENLVGSPIESFDLFKQPDTTTAVVEQPTAVPETPPTNTSPYYANYLKRQQELAEAANAPELIPEDMF